MEEKPKDIAELDFFTRQIMDEKGFAFMWVYKPLCPKCSKARIKKLKKRDKVYTCSECKAAFELPEYVALLNYNLECTCPKCGKKSEMFGHWEKPKSKNAPTVLKFKCEHCGEKLKVIRMKKDKPPKKKGMDAE
jgi:predicted RNA-binding Zn-ribbon protein involved in translation (DUF1610 family)